MNTSCGHWRWTAIAAALLALEGPALAAEEVLELIEFNGAPIVMTMQTLARQAGVNCIVDPRVPGSTFGAGRLIAAPSVTGRWTNQTASAALANLLQQHQLTLVTNPATTVARIAPLGGGVKPVPVNQVRTNGQEVQALIAMGPLPLTDALGMLAKASGIAFSFGPEVLDTAFNGQGNVTVRWEKLTARQALAALLDNYDLVMSEDLVTSTARITRKPGTALERKRP